MAITDIWVRSNANAFTPVTSDSTNGFSGWMKTAPGGNNVTLEAKDTSPNANLRTDTDTINVTGSSRTPAYDLNSSMTNNVTCQIYLWDAESRLIKITYADNSSTEFGYNGNSRPNPHHVAERRQRRHERQTLSVGRRQPARQRA